jgi:hypothetical protein
MMLSVTTAAVALLASTLGAAPAVSAADIPPMIVMVITAADMSSQLVARVLAEADAVWRPSGVSFVWRRVPSVVPSTQASESGPSVPTTLRVVIGTGVGVGRDGRLALGWILFDGVSDPEREIYLSLANARAMMDESRGVIGIVDQMPIVQRETLLGRAIGRALAHELGHYLLASKVHTKYGLMKAALTAVELFMPDASTLRIEPAQRRTVAARLRGEPLVASR